MNGRAQMIRMARTALPIALLPIALLALIGGGVSRAASAAPNERLLNKIDHVQNHIERVTDHVVLKLNQPAAKKAERRQLGQPSPNAVGPRPLNTRHLNK